MDLMFYLYISHNKEIIADSNRVVDSMLRLNYDHYAIFYGGQKKFISNNHIIHIDCDDSYEGLPNKIHKISQYIINNTDYANFSHFCKIDSTTHLSQLIPLITTNDYYGLIVGEGYFSRSYHLKKCSSNNTWNIKNYTGSVVPYCQGGCYVLSRKSVEIVANCPNNSEYDIYEDLYVGQKLLSNNIKPQHLNIKEYLVNKKWRQKV